MKGLSPITSKARRTVVNSEKAISSESRITDFDNRQFASFCDKYFLQSCQEKVLVIRPSHFGPMKGVARFSFIVTVLLAAVVANITVPTATATEQLVPTPAGLFPAQCIHEVPSYSTVLPDGSVLMPNGTRVAFPACPQTPLFSFSTNPSFPTSGHVEYGQVAYNGITSISGDWYAPSAPSSYTGQTIYLWDGLEPSNTGSVLQSVLQYGVAPGPPPTGGQFWQMENWYVTGTSAIYSTPIRVSAGDWLNGQTTWYNNKWNLLSQDISANKLSVLYVSQSITEYYGFVDLEVYQVQSCSGYPASGSTNFFSLGFQPSFTPNWSGHVIINDGCGENVQIVSSSSVTLYY